MPWDAMGLRWAEERRRFVELQLRISISVGQTHCLAPDVAGSASFAWKVHPSRDIAMTVAKRFFPMVMFAIFHCILTG